MNILVYVSILIYITFSFSSYATEKLENELYSHAKDLEDLVGTSFICESHKSIHIHNVNKRGEAVGIASFKNPNPGNGNHEEVAWYWNPKIGFQIITTQTELINHYQKDCHKTPFQFYTLVINDLGVVAGSFLIDQKGYNQNPWLWWSIADGLHLSQLPENYQILQDINDKGDILITEINKSAFVKNIYNKSYFRRIEYPSQEMMLSATTPLLPYDPWENRNENIKNYNVHFGALNAEKIDANSNVTGEGRIVFFHKKGIPEKDYYVVINFEGFERLEEVYLGELGRLHSKEILYSRDTSCPVDSQINPTEIPKWVVFIFQKYSSLIDVINKNQNDALILLKHHLYRPDESGTLCTMVIQSLQPSPLELIKICIPPRIYLLNHPNFFNDLISTTLKSNKHNKTEILQYLLNQDIAFNCEERDKYNLQWYCYEMKKMGAQEGESLNKFISRKSNQVDITKFPFEVRETFKSNLQKNGRFQFEMLWIENFYHLKDILFYGEDEPKSGIWHDDFSNALNSGIFFSVFGDPKYWKLLEILFPNAQYRLSHPEKLSQYLDTVVWKICREIGTSRPHLATLVLNFLKEQGVDLNSLCIGIQDSSYPIASKIIKDAINDGLVKPYGEPTSKKSAKYVPYWA